MIIKNGSITFENEGKTIGWDEDDDSHYPDQPNGKDVKCLKAVVKYADGECDTMKGNKLVVTYTFDKDDKKQKFEVKATGKEPKIKPKDKLYHDPLKKELSFGKSGEGRISEVELGGKRCTFSSANGVITIYYIYV